MKWVKQHAVTVNKRRAVEMALADREDRIAEHGDQGEGFSSEKDIMQGLYAQNQTEFYVPDPVVDVSVVVLPAFSDTSILKSQSQGKVPKNQFGNLDLYVPSMLPAGAVHIPCESRPLFVIFHFFFVLRMKLRRQGNMEDRTPARIRLRGGGRK